MNQLMRRPDVGFVVVSAAEKSVIDEAILLCERLRALGLSLSGVVVNRVHHAPGHSPSHAELAARLSAASGFSPEELSAGADAILQSHREITVLAASDERQLQRLADAARVPLSRVPLFDRDVHDLEGLTRLLDALQ